MVPGLAAADRLHIVTTFLPAFCFAANVAGEWADVANLLPGTVNLHDYQLTPGDIRKLAAADLIVVNGLGLETFLDKAIANAGPNTARKIVRLSDGLESELIPEIGGGAPNPHLWLDPLLAIRSVTNIAGALAARDPAHAAAYARNAAAYVERLRTQEAANEATIAPVRNIAFVTYHNAFPYFVRHYGLKLAGVVERVPEVPPSPKEMSRLLAAIRQEKAKALFTEPPGETRMAQQVASDANIKTAELDPLETGPMERHAYEEGMKRNAQTLRRILSP